MGQPLLQKPESLLLRLLPEGEAASGTALIAPTFLYALALLGLPILTVIAYSFWSADYLTIDHTLTLANYRKALFEPIYQDLMLRSLWVSLVVSLVTVAFSYPVAWYISFRGGIYKDLLLFLVTVPCWISYLLRVMSWKVILGYQGALNTGLSWLGLIDQPITSLLYNTNAVVITLAHSWAAFAILPIYVSLEKIDRQLVEAAQDLGDSPLKAFARIVLPLSMPGCVSALLIVMIPTVGDYITPKLVGGTDGMMIATAIQAQFGKGGDWPLGAALSVTTMFIVTAVAMLTVWLLRLVIGRIR